MAEVIIFTDDPGWHGKRLQEAFLARNVSTRFVSLRDCGFDLHQPGSHIAIPGCRRSPPDGVFVRGVPGGTLEQVVSRLDVLHALKLLGVPVYNDGRAIERTVDKAMTSFVLANAGIATPATWVTETHSRAAEIVRSEIAAGHELVMKPLFGSQGVGLQRISMANELPAAPDDGVYYLQRFIASSTQAWHDLRVFVIHGCAVAAMQRHGKTWITNVSQGARCVPVDLSSNADIGAIAEKACRALQIDYAGVDLIRDPDGLIYVVEVNGIPAWKGLQSVTQPSIAAMLANDFVDRYLRRPTLHSVA